MVKGRQALRKHHTTISPVCGFVSLNSISTLCSHKIAGMIQYSHIYKLYVFMEFNMCGQIFYLC
jgi:hypothetical protein